MRFWQQARAQCCRPNRVRFIENRVAPRFETRECHQKSESNNQSEKSQERLLQRGNVAARTVAVGSYTQSPSKFARQKDNGGANKEDDKIKVVGEESHDLPKELRPRCYLRRKLERMQPDVRNERAAS